MATQQMTLSDALRWQKRVVAIIRKIEQTAKTSNAVQEGTVREFDVRKLCKLRERWVDHLVDLKLRKQDATRPIQGDVFKLAELKSAIAFFQQIPVTHGLVASHSRYTAEAKAVRWDAEIRARERDGYVATLQKEIDATQRKIDSFNFQTKIMIDVPEDDEYSAAIEVPEGAVPAATEDEQFD